jgi:hypothetical protein
MKLYAFTTPEISKHSGYLKIGETNGDVEKAFATVKEQFIRKHCLKYPPIINFVF